MSSIKSIYLSEDLSSLKNFFTLSSNMPRNVVPPISSIMSSIMISLSMRLEGTSSFSIRSARPYTIAVFPHPPLPTSTALFFFLLASILMISLTSLSLPTILSIFPCFAKLDKLMEYLFMKSFLSLTIELSLKDTWLLYGIWGSTFFFFDFLMDFISF